MIQFIGQFPINVLETEYCDYTKSDWALTFIERYGSIDGAHHKAWVLDQVARILLGTNVIVEEARWDNGRKELRFHTSEDTSPQYKRWALAMRGNEIDGEYEYEYDEGIAP